MIFIRFLNEYRSIILELIKLNCRAHVLDTNMDYNKGTLILCRLHIINYEWLLLFSTPKPYFFQVMPNNIDCYIFHGLCINKHILNSDKAISHDFHRIRTATKSEIRFAHHTNIIATSICNTYFCRDPSCLTHSVSIQNNIFTRNPTLPL